MRSSQFFGIAVALALWVTAAVVVPYVQFFPTLAPTELMVIRGGITAALIFLLFRKQVGKPSRDLLGAVLIISLANWSFYQSVRILGANPTIVIFTTLPLASIVLSLIRGKKVPGRDYVSALILMIGVVLALQPWKANYTLIGLMWAVAVPALLAVGFGWFSQMTDLGKYQKGLWMSLAFVGTGLVVTLLQKGVPLANQDWSGIYLLHLVIFGVACGFIYFMTNILLYDYYKPVHASLILVGETPASLLGTYFLLGETMTIVQLLGVFIAMAASVAQVWKEDVKG